MDLRRHTAKSNAYDTVNADYLTCGTDYCHVPSAGRSGAGHPPDGLAPGPHSLAPARARAAVARLATSPSAVARSLDIQHQHQSQDHV